MVYISNRHGHYVVLWYLGIRPNCSVLNPKAANRAHRTQEPCLAQAVSNYATK